jgi:hypothetical protein
MRARNRLTAAEWQARLDREMERVLAAPQRFPPAALVWARWRRTWLAESGSLFYQPVARAEVAEGEGLTGPSCGPARAGEPVCTIALAAAPKIGCHPRVVAPSLPATIAGSSTSVPFRLSLPGDNLGARGGRNGAAGRGRAVAEHEKTFALQIVLW